jgi:hypothetical protein
LRQATFLYAWTKKGIATKPAPTKDYTTNAGYGVGSGFQTVKELRPNSTILEGFSIKGGVERDGVYLVIKDEKGKEAETAVKKWFAKNGAN